MNCAYFEFGHVHCQIQGNQKVFLADKSINWTAIICNEMKTKFESESHEGNRS